MACWYRLTVAPGETVELRLRLARDEAGTLPDLGEDFERTMAEREREADEFYARSARERERRRGGGDAPGVRRHGLEPAVLPL